MYFKGLTKRQRKLYLLEGIINIETFKTFVKGKGRKKVAISLYY
jgi:hypothetical protein